jgi:hypothetical protein
MAIVRRYIITRESRPKPNIGWLFSSSTVVVSDSLPWLHKKQVPELPPDEALRLTGWRPWFTGRGTELQWLARKRPAEVSEEPTGRVVRWQPWLQPRFYNTEWLLKRAQQPEPEEILKRSLWSPATSTVSDSLPWFAKRRGEDQIEEPVRVAHWQPWLTQPASLFDYLPWLAKPRAQAAEEEVPHKAFWKPALTAPVVVVYDSLPWLRKKALSVDEAELNAQRSLWQPSFTEADSLPWIAKRYGQPGAEEIGPRPSFNPALLGTVSVVDQIPWRVLRGFTPEEKTAAAHRSTWQPSMDTLAPVRDQLGWHAFHPKYEPVEWFQNPLLWKPWMYQYVPPVIVRPTGTAISASPLGGAVAGSPTATVD